MLSAVVLIQRLCEASASVFYAKPRYRYRFQNWAKTYSCVPEQLVEPQSVDELIKIVEKAGRERKKLKVVGAGHSPSDIACTDGLMINIRHLNRVLQIDEEKMQITVEAGAVLSDIVSILARRGLAMSNLGAITEQTVSGAISTGTHGTGLPYGILATQVIEMAVLTMDGKLLECSPAKNAEVFTALQCGLGALGIIVYLTLQCESAYLLRAQQKFMKVDDLLNNIDLIAHAGEHTRAWWFPHNNEALVWSASRVANTTEKVDTGHALWNQVVGYYALEFAYFLSVKMPWMVRWINRIFFRLLFRQVHTVVDDSEKVFTFDCLFLQYVDEWSIPFECTAQALQALRHFVESENIAAHFPVEVRFVKGDNIPLSPCYGRDSTFIGIIAYRPYGLDINHAPYFARYEQIMASFGGRPHWAKAHLCSRKDFVQMYPLFGDFLKIREQLDPHNLLMNDYLQRCFVDE